jgi:hypothetical protein
LLQYRVAIFYHGEEQMMLALKSGEREAAKKQVMADNVRGPLGTGLNFLLFYLLFFNDEQGQPAIPAIPIIRTHW